MEFLIGGIYRNRRGEYEILAIEGDTLQVRYDDGAVDQLKATIQARIARNMAIEDAAKAPSQDEAVNRAFFTTSRTPPLATRRSGCVTGDHLRSACQSAGLCYA
ncbi:MAG: hypothetical protein M3Q71_16495 [Chloroflexota bacterium]|nr:hypothetical protein [Chloroflexota bacterium]MDP9472239.1 hypothetical protein [Chloroflexota bacterium]